MRRATRIALLLVGVAAPAAPTVLPGHAATSIEGTSFTGGGLADGRAIFIRATAVGLPGVGARVGMVIDGGNVMRGSMPAAGLLDCATFVPSMRGGVAVGGTLYASAIIDDNKRLIRAVDHGPGGGGDEVGIIIVDSAPDPNGANCGADDVPTSPLTGEFIGVRGVA